LVFIPTAKDNWDFYLDIIKKLTTKMSTPAKPVTSAKIIRALINYADEHDDFDFKGFLPM